MKQRRYQVPLLLAALAVAAVLMHGCGGSETFSYTSDVHGTVADLERNVVIDADVWIGTHRTKSLATGAFRLREVPSGWQTIRASAIVDGTQWEGSTAVEVLDSGPTMNANIVLIPAGDATSITGRVYDDTGRPISGARVLLTTRLTSSDDGPYGSIVAITDSRGNYRLEKVPMGTYAAVMASKVAFDNQEVRRTITDRIVIDFELVPSRLETPNAPVVTDIYSWTMPIPLVRSLSVTGLPEGNPYDAIRAFTSPKFRESLKSRAVAPTSTATVKSASTGGLIEIDVAWQGVAGSLARTIAGYGIYRRIGSNWPPRAIDFVRDPYANFYGDMGGEIEPDLTYRYRVTAVNVEFLDRYNDFIDMAESDWSVGELSVAPLGYLRAVSPSNGASVSGDPLFTWEPVYRADAYSVYVYYEFPKIPIGPGEVYPSYGVPPIWDSPWESGTSVRYAGPPLQRGHRYYWVVTASDAAGIAYSYSELRSFVAN